MKNLTLDRRHFLQASAAAGALLITYPSLSFAQSGDDGVFKNQTSNLGIFIRIDEDNKITIGYPVPEDGTGVATSLPMQVAEELDVNFNQVNVDKLPPMYKKHESEDTYLYDTFEDIPIHQASGGSQATRRTYKLLRLAGAHARALLVQAASEQLGVATDELTTNNGYVIYKAGDKKLSYGSLTSKAATVTLDEIPELKDIKDYKLIGTDQPQKAAKDIAMGKPLYCTDMSMPGMLNAVIARCPYFDGLVKSYDDTEALKIKGVKKIVRIHRIPENREEQKIIADGVAVIADSHWAALKGREALKIEWDDRKWAQVDNAWIDKEFDRAIKEKEPTTRIEHGDFKKAYADADKTLEVAYEQPYWSHVTMETPVGFVDYKDDKITIIAGNQNVIRVINDLRKVFPHDADQFDIRTARIGSGFGRKGLPDAVIEAALCSKEVGRPVKLIWTREDDIEQDFFNPKGRHIFKGGIDKNGKLIAAHYLHCSTDNDFATHAFPAYHVPNYLGQVIQSKVLPSGPWRGPTENVAGYAMQSFVDEMAHMAGICPLKYRLDMFEETGDTPYPGFSSDFMVASRFINTLKLAAKNAGWGKELPKGHGMGVASFMTFGGYAAAVVEVKVDEEGNLTIVNVSAASDPGIAINPLGCRAQIEGGTLDGFSAALGQKVEIKGGRVISNNFDTYEMARIGASPANFVADVVPSTVDPMGIGEMALPAAIPALCNAIFDACGVRIRKLPIANQIKEAMGA